MTTPDAEIPFARPSITEAERAAVMAVLESPILTHGPACKGFESEFAAFVGRGSALTVSSCMAALHISCLELGFGPGDEVLVPALTHVATVHAVEWTGARPVFVDCDPATGNVTPEGLEAARTPRTRGVVLVHFLGIPCRMDAIMAWAGSHGIRVVEDCALAVGTLWKGRHVGTWGDFGCFSFYPVKHITTAEGGMLTVGDPELTKRAGLRRAFGVDRSHAEREFPGYYDVVSLGLNYRMSELQAALGRVQLGRFPEFLAARRRNAAAWKRELAGVEGIRLLEDASPDATSSWYCLVVALPASLRAARNAIVMDLKAAGIGTSIYYPNPVPRMRYYREKYGYDAARYPNAEAVSDGSIALPLGPHIGEAEVVRCATALKAALARARS